MNLEICTDASMRSFNTKNGIRDFGCAGALCINTMQQDYLISQDTTNNRAELLGLYLAVKLGKSIMDENPGVYDKIIIYSDSKFSIYGITRWINTWVENTKNGIMYGSTGKPVKNQELFTCILNYITLNKLRVSFKHCKGHVNCYNYNKLSMANDVYNTSNGEYLRPEDIFKISFYNDIVDKNTREKLKTINPDIYPKLNYDENFKVMTSYTIPKDYKKYIER